MVDSLHKKEIPFLVPFPVLGVGIMNKIFFIFYQPLPMQTRSVIWVQIWKCNCRMWYLRILRSETTRLSKPTAIHQIHHSISQKRRPRGARIWCTQNKTHLQFHFNFSSLKKLPKKFFLFLYFIQKSFCFCLRKLFGIIFHLLKFYFNFLNREFSILVSMLTLVFCFTEPFVKQ